MNLNTAVIPHYRSEMIDINVLKDRVALNINYLKEKPTWYEIDGRLQYFKIRNDFRLFNEQFFSMFGRDILGIDTLDYKVAYVRTINPLVKKSEEITKCGLLSENFQTPDYNYYLVSELMNSRISNFISYGGYNLESLLNFFKDYLEAGDYKKNELFLIKLFIADAFTHQEDRNYNNIGFKIPKIDGVHYTKRLHPTYLGTLDNVSDHCVKSENGNWLLKDLSPTKVYDNERILGTDHKNVFTYHSDQVWCPLFPYRQELLFESQDKALAFQSSYDGLDPNLCELYINHSETCLPIFERLAYDDEYKKILEQFKENTSQIKLSDVSRDRIENLFKDKQKTLKKILLY